MSHPSHPHEPEQPDFAKLFEQLLGGGDPAMADALKSMGLDRVDPSMMAMLAGQLQAMFSAPATGGVDLEMCADVARKTVMAEGGDAAVLEKERRAAQEAGHVAQLWLEQVTSFAAPGGPVTAWSRAEWVAETMPMWGRLVSPVAEGVTSAMTSALKAQLDDLGQAGQHAADRDLKRQPIRGAALPGGVHQRHDAARGPAVLDHGPGRIFGGEEASVLAPQNLVRQPHRLAVQPRRHQGAGRMRIGCAVGMAVVDQLVHIATQDLLRLIAQHPQGGGVGVAAAPLGVHAVKADAQRLEHGVVGGRRARGRGQGGWGQGCLVISASGACLNSVPPLPFRPDAGPRKGRGAVQTAACQVFWNLCGKSPQVQDNVSCSCASGVT